MPINLYTLAEQKHLPGIESYRVERQEILNADVVDLMVTARESGIRGNDKIYVLAKDEVRNFEIKRLEDGKLGPLWVRKVEVASDNNGIYMHPIGMFGFHKGHKDMLRVLTREEIERLLSGVIGSEELENAFRAAEKSRYFVKPQGLTLL